MERITKTQWKNPMSSNSAYLQPLLRGAVILSKQLKKLYPVQIYHVRRHSPHCSSHSLMIILTPWSGENGNIHLLSFINASKLEKIARTSKAYHCFCFVNRLNFDPRIGQLIALPLITIISFVGHKYWSFNGIS